MTRDQIDALWQQALHEAIQAGEQYTRYHFAALIEAAEREECAQLCDDINDRDANEANGYECAARIRDRGQQ